MRLTKPQLAIISIIIANIIWGAAAPIFKWSLTSVTPFTLGFFRFFIATILLLPFTYKHLYVARKDFLLLFLTAFVGIALHIGFFFLGLQYAPSINVPIIASSAPIFIIIASVFFLHQKQKPKVVIGTIISLIGVLTIILRPAIEDGFTTAIIGNLFFLFSTIAGVGHLFLLKKIIHKYSCMTITFWTFFIGQFFFLLLMLHDMQSPEFIFSLDTKSIVGIAFGALFSSAISWLLHAYATKQLPASEIGIFTYIDPIMTALIALPLLGETITFSYLLGTVLVFLGIFIAEGRLHYHPFHKLTTA